MTEKLPQLADIEKFIEQVDQSISIEESKHRSVELQIQVLQNAQQNRLLEIERKKDTLDMLNEVRERAASFGTDDERQTLRTGIQDKIAAQVPRDDYEHDLAKLMEWDATMHTTNAEARSIYYRKRKNG